MIEKKNLPNGKPKEEERSVVDIIRTLQEHFQTRAPIFCDNRESVTDLPAMGCQIISLVVSPEDKALRIETIKERMAT